ncbi:MAG: PAS domain S-box protein, partial [Chloroflexi bacterium]|nr:PAS domain S-box protein [Chloroflexota bacterium]
MKNDMSTTRHPAAEIRRACPATPAPETKAHSTLERGEHYYRALIENAPDMIVVLNGDGTIQYTSPSAERLHGYRAEDMIGKNGFDMIHPDDMIGCLEAYTLMIDTPNAKISRQLRLKSREGSWRHVEITAKNLLHDPVVNGIVINHRDITERKQAETELRESEEKYRLLMDNSGIPVTYFSLSGHVLLINKIGAKNLGGVPEDFVGKSISEILPQMADRMLEMNERIIASGIGEEHEDLIALPAGHRWFRSSIQPVKDAEGRVLAIQIVSPDITERKQVEEWTRVQRDLTHKLSAITRLDQALALCVTTAITATGMDCGGAYVADRETGGLDLVYPIGLSPDSVASVSHYSADCPNTRLVMAAKPTYALVSELNLPPDDSFRREALRVIAVIPITHEGEVIACLNVGSHTLDAIPVTSR